MAMGAWYQFDTVHPCRSVWLDRILISGQPVAVSHEAAAPRAVLIVGAQAAGKTSVGQALARRFNRAAFIEGDALWQMIVAGRHDMSASVDPEAERQLVLRYRHGAMLCESFVQAGFSAVHVENMYGPIVEQHVRALRSPRSLVVLRPSIDAIERRYLERGGEAYRPWIPLGGSIRDAIRRFDEWIAETPPIGLWIDSSDIDVDATVDEVLARWPESFIE
jgi:hypothetical protein